MIHLTDIIEEEKKSQQKILERANYQRDGWTSVPLGDLNKLPDHLDQAMTKAALSVYDDILSKLDGYKIIDGISFDGSLPPADIFAEMIDDTNMIRDHVNGVIDFIKADVIAIKETLTTPKE